MKLLTKAQTIELINQGFYLVRTKSLFSYWSLVKDEKIIYSVKKNVAQSLAKNLSYCGNMISSSGTVDQFYKKNQG
jgi:hypothetical protein